MARSKDPVTILPTGWRITGRNAEKIAARAAVASIESLDPPASAEPLYAVQFTMPSVVRGRTTVEVALDAIGDDIRRTCAECPRLKRDEETFLATSRFSGMRYTFAAKPGKEWIGEIVGRSVHGAVAGAPVTTHVIIEERSGYTRFSVRVTADEGRASVRGYVGAGQSQPAFIRALATHANPTWLGGPLAAHTVNEIEVEHFVRDILENTARDIPVALLSPREDGTFVVEPEELMWEMFGCARVYVIYDYRITYRLSDVLGDRRLSCYWGASRCYFPDFTRHDDPRDHPLLVAERLTDPIMRATWRGEIGMWSADLVEWPQSVAQRLQNVEQATVPAVAATPERATPTIPEASAQSLLVAELLREIRNIATITSTLADEVERLRTISAVRSSSTAAIERRLGRLEDILYRAFTTPSNNELLYATSADTQSDLPDQEDEGRVTLVEVVQTSSETHTDTLLFLDSTLTSAAASPYEDPERIRAILDAMARVSRLRMEGALRTSLREAFSDLGIEYRAAIARSTPARLREQYRFRQANGSLVEAEEHIVVGHVYDPRRCLRIYFSSRVPNEPRFVIAHVGRHFEVMTTT